jgi:predicted phage terminase large subunit-like protein
MQVIPAEPVTKQARLREAAFNPATAVRELCNREFFYFLEYFWPEVSGDQFKSNWHIEYLSAELQEIAERVAQRLPKKHDLIINIPPGTTKTLTASIMFPAWCWTRWHWMRFITASYSGALSLESAEYSRDLVRSRRFKRIYPELEIKPDKDTKGNFRIIKHLDTGRVSVGGNRFSTSVGGTLTGFHGHILIVDDPLNPNEAVSEQELKNSVHWFDQTLPTRKTDKEVTPTILIMQRLHQGDPAGHILAKKKPTTKLISLPGECRTYAEQVHPARLKDAYIDDLLDPVRMPWSVLAELEVDLGQYGYASQIGQNPTPPGGGLFRVEHLENQILTAMPPDVSIVASVRAWDKAGSEGKGAYTVGAKMHRLANGKFIISDLKRGQWATHEREAVIRSTAEGDGPDVVVYVEQEPGSGGKESAEATIRNLAGYSVYADRPTGDKTFRADPLSVQVNNANISLLRGEWNRELIEEFRFFPFSKFKDIVDACSLAMAKLTKKREVRSLLRSAR